MVSGHRKLSMLFLDDEVVQVVLLREFIAESQTVVEKPEADHDVTLVVGLFKGYGQFVVMVPDFVRLLESVSIELIYPIKIPC